MIQDRILEKMKLSGAKLTGVRKAVVVALTKGANKPMSAEWIHGVVSKSRKTRCDLASVYRTLTLLEELGVVRRSDLFGTASHFELVKEGHHHRHHIVCKSCQKIEAIDFCLVQAENQALKRLGYKDVSHRLEFLGLCPACA